jgi:hypothetical protein
MHKKTRFCGFWRIAVAIVYLLFLARPGFSQSKEAALRPTQARLVAIQDCLKPLSGDQVNELGKGLLWGWKNWVNTWPKRGGLVYGGILWPTYDWQSSEFLSPPADSLLPDPPPQEYLDSLDNDLRACSFASAVNDKSIRDAVLKSVARDIAIKAKDCKDFGMGRLIPVRVTTMRGNQPEDGWEAFFKWVPASAFPTKELRIPHLTSPAVKDLPPGEYVFRAQKTSASHVEKAGPVTITVGSTQVEECQLPIQ